MSLTKRLLEEYCAAIHPDDDDAQYALFDEICAGEVVVSMEEMSRIVNQQGKPMPYPKLLFVLKQPGQAPERIEAQVPEKDTLSLVQGIVGGYVEQVYVSNEVAILCDEDGISKGLPHNCGFLGPILFIGLGKEDWTGLTPEQAQKAVTWCFLHSPDVHPGSGW